MSTVSRKATYLPVFSLVNEYFSLSLEPRALPAYLVPKPYVSAQEFLINFMLHNLGSLFLCSFISPPDIYRWFSYMGIHFSQNKREQELDQKCEPSSCVTNSFWKWHWFSSSDIVYTSDLKPSLFIGSGSSMYMVSPQIPVTCESLTTLGESSTTLCMCREGQVMSAGTSSAGRTGVTKAARSYPWIIGSLQSTSSFNVWIRADLHSR